MTNNNNKQGNNKNQNRNSTMPFHNDQLGENASEEYKSEEYSNAIQSSKKKGSV